MDEQLPSLTSFFIKHAVDIVLVAVFFYIFFFCKPDPNAAPELSPEEQPNELEKILVSDPETEEDEKGEKTA